MSGCAQYQVKKTSRRFYIFDKWIFRKKIDQYVVSTNKLFFLIDQEALNQVFTNRRINNAHLFPKVYLEKLLICFTVLQMPIMVSFSHLIVYLIAFLLVTQSINYFLEVIENSIWDAARPSRKNNSFFQFMILSHWRVQIYLEFWKEKKVSQYAL